MRDSVNNVGPLAAGGTLVLVCRRRSSRVNLGRFDASRRRFGPLGDFDPKLGPCFHPDLGRGAPVTFSAWATDSAGSIFFDRLIPVFKGVLESLRFALSFGTPRAFRSDTNRPAAKPELVPVAGHEHCFLFATA
jgi:hypothetical protein